MKPMSLIMGLSLAANLALGAAWLWRASASAGSPSAALTAAAPLATKKSPVVPASAAPDVETWRNLNAGSNTDFVARLRAEGFPSSVILRLAYARVAEQHAETLKKFKPSADYAYWRRNNPFGFQEDDLTPEQRTERRALQREMGEEMQRLLGQDLDQLSPYMRAERVRTYGDLPQGKVDQLTSINRDYSELAMMVRDRMQGVTLPEDRAQLAALEAEKRADLASTLTPAELIEYDLRASPSARAVQARLRYFEPTEEEYRAITGLQLAFDQTYGGANPSGAQQQQRTEAQAELAAQIKALLPPERFAEYEIKTDNSYQQMASLVTQYSPTADAVEAVRTQRDLATRYNALRNDRSLAPEVRNAQLDALANEARNRMSTVLGPKAYEMFKMNGGPINSLVNRKPGKP